MDETKPMKFSEQFNIVKLVTSSIFARKQKFLILNGNKPDTFYYTNIPHERMALYRSAPDDVISKVTIKSPNVMAAFYDAFPKLASVIAEIDVQELSTNLNKAKKEYGERFPPIDIGKLNENSLSMSVGGVDKPIGRLLPEHGPVYYEEVLDNFNKFSDNVVKRQFRAAEQVGDDKLVLEIVDLELNKGDKSEFGIPVKDGVTMVSTKEYVNKRNLDPLYDVVLRVNPESRTSRAAILYSDDWLDSMTIMPGLLWFMTKL